jgi:hypothetical protein
LEQQGFIVLAAVKKSSTETRRRFFGSAGNYLFLHALLHLHKSNFNLNTPGSMLRFSYVFPPPKKKKLAKKLAKNWQKIG